MKASSPLLSRLHFRDVSLTLGQQAVLSNVSFDVQGGEIFGLLGPNGSGKSSLLTLVTGLRPAFEGAISFEFADGTVVPPAHARLDGQLGVVFQNPSLDAKLTAEENLRITCMLAGIPSSERASRIARALEEVDLSESKSKRVGALSGGMKRRLDLARALLWSPTLLVLDEPTSGIDESSFRSFWALLDATRVRLGMTLLLATHRPEEAEMCTRVALFSHGKAIEVARPADLKRRLSRDVIVLSTQEPERVISGLRSSLGLEAVQVGSELRVEANDAHALVPRIVESFPAGTLTSVALRGASMADVFHKVTGHALEY